MPGLGEGGEWKQWLSPKQECLPGTQLQDKSFCPFPKRLATPRVPQVSESGASVLFTITAKSNICLHIQPACRDLGLCSCWDRSPVRDSEGR